MKSRDNTSYSHFFLEILFTKLFYEESLSNFSEIDWSRQISSVSGLAEGSSVYPCRQGTLSTVCLRRPEFVPPSLKLNSFSIFSFNIVIRHLFY